MLAGQVFGAPFIGSFEQHDGGTVRFPMDFMGTTVALPLRQVAVRAW